MTVTTRFAPSPTGFLHVGNARTAVLNWLLARKTGGRFLLRIDDTDDSRSEERFVDAIRRDLDWLGLEPDGEVRQSARAGAHEAAAAALRASGRLYPCRETPEELDLRRKSQLQRGLPPVYDRAALNLTPEAAAAQAGRPEHWRFLLDQSAVEWEDHILGPRRIDAASLSDPVLIREDGRMLYTLSSVTDDAEMGITHVARGADHVANTAVQIQIFAALGHGAPAFAHHSLLTAPGGAKLSKRAESLSLADLREGGAEPLAVVAFLARLGTSDPIEPRASLEEIAAGFDITRFGAASTAFDEGELAILSAKTLRDLPYEAVRARLAALDGPAPDAPEALWAAVGPNLDRLSDFSDWARIAEEGAAPLIAPEDADFVAEALAALPPRPWDASTWSVWTGAVKAATGRKGRALFLPLRRALTGRDHGPDMAALMPLLKAPT